MRRARPSRGGPGPHFGVDGCTADQPVGCTVKRAALRNDHSASSITSFRIKPARRSVTFCRRALEPHRRPGGKHDPMIARTRGHARDRSRFYRIDPTGGGPWPTAPARLPSQAPLAALPIPDRIQAPAVPPRAVLAGFFLALKGPIAPPLRGTVLVFHASAHTARGDSGSEASAVGDSETGRGR